MIDLHCHLLYGCDDGPKLAAESQALARALVDAGVGTVACTPHIRGDKGWRNVRAVQPALHARLRAALDSAGITLDVTSGAEHYLDENLAGDLAEGRVAPYGSGRYLLIELPYSGPPVDLLGQLFQVRTAGYRVLLAHLERFAYVVDDAPLLRKIVDAGYLIQVNLGSLAGVYTRAHRKAAVRLLKGGLVSVLAGDCHRAADVEPNIVKGKKAALKLIDADELARLCTDNPRRILDDEDPARIWP